MASNIKFKRSAVQNRVPTTAQLELGELALNTYDGKLYTEKNSGSAAVVEIGSILSSLVVDGANGGGGGDVVFHGTTAGRDLTWDYSANHLKFNDNAKGVFGSGSDMAIHHSGSAGIIKNITGILQIQGNDVRIKNAADNADLAKFVNGGAAELYNDGSLRIATTADGADVSGTGSLKLPVGTTAQRNGSPTAGDMRYNSEIGSFEGYTTGWGALGGESGVGIGSTTVNPGSGVVNPLIGVGYTTINFVGAGLSVTGYGTTIVVDLGGVVSRKYGRKIHAYTATANQTTFAGLSYTNAAAQISVYLNGAKLSAATYTATSGSTVVLGTGASVGDEVEIICIDSGVDLSRNVTSYTATANQTTFTGLGYSDGGDLDVYLNGIRLAQSDYTANNGTSLVLATGASVGDLLEVVDMGQGAQWSSGFGADADDIYRLNGGVGIGTTNPTDKLNIVGNAEVLGILTATTFKGAVSGTTGTFSGAVSGTTGTFSGSGSVSGDLDVAADIRHIGDTDTRLRFETDTISIRTGGSPRVTVTDATTTVANNLTVTGNLQVDGTNTVVNSTTMTVDDKNIVLASGAANDAAADGGGITLESGNGNKTFNWVDSTDAWTSSEHIHVVAGKKLGIGVAPSYPLHVTSTGTESVRFYGDSGGSNALLRFQFDEINDDLVAAAGPRTFIGDGSADIVIGTQNSSFTPSNSFISLEHDGKIRMAAGASPGLASEGITIDTAGKVGINQNTPTAQLQIGAPNTATGVLRADPAYFSIDAGYANGGSVGGVVGSNTNPALIFGGDSNTGLYHSASDTLNFTTGGTERLRIDSNGRNIINGTSNGSRAIFGDHHNLQVEKNSSGLLSLLRTSNDNGAAWISIAKSRSAAGAACQADDNIGGIAFVAHDGNDLNHCAASIRGYVDTGISTDDTPGYLTFRTNGGASGTTERLRITSGGAIQNYYNTNLPVTDSRPILQLGYGVIGDDSSGYNAVTCNAYPVNGNSTWHYIGSSSLGASRYHIGFGDHKWYTASAGTRGNDITWSERLRIANDGRVLVNSTAVTNSNDFLTIKRPAGNTAITSMTLDATSTTATYANALIFTKAKDYYYNGLVFTSSDGHQGGIAGKMTTNGGSTPQIEIRIGGTSLNQSDKRALTIHATGECTQDYIPAWSLRPSYGSNQTLGSGTHAVGWSSSDSGIHSVNAFLQNVTLGGSSFGSNLHNGQNYGKIIVPVAGKYQINCSIRMENNPTAGNIWLYVNGSLTRRQHVEMWNHRPYMHGQITTVVELPANGHIIWALSCNGGVVSGINDYCNHCSGHLIG